MEGQEYDSKSHPLANFLKVTGNIYATTLQRVKEDSRSNSKDLNETIKQIEDDMEKLEEKVIKQIQIALENPLSNMK